MKNTNIKRSRGRPQYEPNIKQLKELFKQVVDKKITNEEAWKQARNSQNIMVQIETSV